MAAKMSDHSHSTSNDSINPTSGTQDVNNGDDSEKTDIQNYIKKGQGVGDLSGRAEPDTCAGSLTSADTMSAATGMFEKKI
jgi:hypothetical protein